LTRGLVSIPLIIEHGPDDRIRLPRKGEPVTLGVPLPRGAARDTNGWVIRDIDGQLTPAQTRALDAWADGSIRWLLVDSQIDVPAEGGAQVALESSGSTSAHASPLRVEHRDNVLTVDTGAAKFTLSAGGTFPFDGIASDGTALIDKAATRFEMTDAAGSVHRATVRGINIIDQGPLRAGVGVDLTFPSGSLQILALYARLDFYAGLSTVRIAIRVRNPQRARHADGFWDLGDPGSVLFKDASLVIALASRPGSTHARCSPEAGADRQKVPLPIELYQDSSGGVNWQSPVHLNRERRVPVRFRGYQLRAANLERTGLRATPVVDLQSGERVVAAAVPHFWQNFPKALEAANDVITFRLWPRQFDDLHELQGGEQKTHVCFLSFGRDGITDEPLEWARARVVARAEPDWYLAVETVPWLAPDEPSHRALISVAVDGPDRFEEKREVIDEFGWRNFGDIYGDHESVRQPKDNPLVSHYNNQYDPVAGFLYQYFRTGDARWWTMATELAAHVIDIDIYHTSLDKSAYNGGMFWHTYHYGAADTSTHRTYPRSALGRISGGGPSGDHNYTTGLMLHYFLTGDEQSLEAVVGLGDWVIAGDDGALNVFRWMSHARTGFASASGSYAYHGPGRSPGNCVNVLLDAHRLTREPKYLHKAEEVIRRVVHPHEDIMRNDLADPEMKWFYLMFLQSLGKYLRYKEDLDKRDFMYAYGRASLLHYARWMAEHEYPYLEKPERLEFPTESWAAIEIRKSDVFFLAALHAQGPERDRFIERGRFFFRNSIDTLGTMPTRKFARPVIVLLTSGLLQPWFLAHPDAAVAPPPGPEPDYGEPASFIPQKQIVKKRLKLIAASGIAVFGVAILTLLLVR
jgi:hypothetical protein